MDSDRIEVFDGANHNTVVVFITHEFQLILFPASDRLFDQHFGGGRRLESGTGDSDKVLFIVCKT